MRLWFWLSLLSAFASASTDAWTKKFFGHGSPFEMAVHPLLYSLPVFLAALAWIPVPPLDAVFWWAFLLSIPLNCGAFLLYMTAIKASPLSLSLPFLAFTPAFMIGTGALLLGERPNVAGFAGIAVVVAGSYILNLDRGRRDLLEPFRAVFRERGSWIMLVVAFIYSFTAVIGKIAIVHSAPTFFGVFFFAVQNLVLVAYVFVLGKASPRCLLGRRQQLRGLLVGAFYAAHVLGHVWAIALTKAAYMISVKRLSLVFGVVYGGILFGESHLKRRMAGAGLMLAGAVVIALGGR